MINERNLLHFRKFLVNLIDKQVKMDNCFDLHKALLEFDRYFIIVDNESEEIAKINNDNTEVFEEKPTPITISERKEQRDERTTKQLWKVVSSR